MKQLTLFEQEEKQTVYSKKIEAPIYEITGPKPHLLTLCDDTKTRGLIKEINASDLPSDEKNFLALAAYRHAVFHYERIAEYYAHATPEMQRLMEKSALVIIDFDKAIELGFVRLCNEIKSQFLEEYAHENAS